MMYREGNGIITQIEVEVKKLQKLADLNTSMIDKYGEQLGKNLRTLKMHQIRRIYTELRRIHSQKSKFDATSLTLLKARFAYAAGRNDEVKPLYELYSKCLPKVQTFDDFEKLLGFFEAVIAYHKYYYPRGGE